MKRSGFLLVAATLLWAMSMPAANAATVSKTVTVHLPGLQHGAVVTIDPTHAMVSFGGSFTSIQAITFHVVMQGDLLDQGEWFHIDGDKVGGRGNFSPIPVSEFYLANPESYHYWLDGHEVIHPEMANKLGDHDDAVRIVDFTATIIGVR